MLEVNSTSLLLIALVAIGTYTLRVSGLLFSNKLANIGKIKLFFEYLPSTLLLALVMPAIIKEGFIGLIATLLIALCMYKTKNILLSMVIAVLFVALCRNFLILN